MEHTVKPFSDIVSEQLKLLETNAFAVEQAHGLKADTIRSVIRSDDRRATPNIDRAREICAALGLEFYIGPPRETEAIPHTMISGKDYATVSYHDVSASAGPGEEVDPNAAVENYAFRREWLKRQGVAPQDAAMLRVRGDSMMPRIADGDVLLINTKRRTPPVTPPSKTGKRRSSIYVVDVDGETRVKWVDRPDMKTLILYSENTARYYPEVFTGKEQDERLRFIGKVIWWGHTER
ncbi:helix-turn-helix transcriptional regulator [Yoonia sp.]|uniref:S24 family peptidase n=1 Tax=Yoonia sp. TaxID=2212373 RepID=UPI00391CFECF